MTNDDYILNPGRPTASEVAALVQELYRQPGHGTGGCLHVVLDDGNIEDSHIRFGINWGRKKNCALCACVGFLLLTMTKTQRARVSQLGPYKTTHPLSAAP
jgi:hypothetical protein